MATPVLPIPQSHSAQAALNPFPNPSGSAVEAIKTPFNQVLEKERPAHGAVPSFSHLSATALKNLGGEATIDGAEGQSAELSDALTAGDNFLPVGGNLLPLEQRSERPLVFAVGQTAHPMFSGVALGSVLADSGIETAKIIPASQNAAQLHQHIGLQEPGLAEGLHSTGREALAGSFALPSQDGFAGQSPSLMRAALAAVNGEAKPTSILRDSARELLADQRSVDGLDSARLAMSRVSAASIERGLSPPQFSVMQNALSDPAWGQAMTARLSWMAGSGVHNASLRLHPEELGSVNVQISMSGDRASVQFQAQNAETTELIEKLMPRLASAFESQGLKLEDAKVSQQPSGGERQQSAMTGEGQGSGQSSAGGRGSAQGNGENADGAVEVGAGNVLDLDLRRASGIDAFA